MLNIVNIMILILYLVLWSPTQLWNWESKNGISVTLRKNEIIDYTSMEKLSTSKQNRWTEFYMDTTHHLSVNYNIRKNTRSQRDWIPTVTATTHLHITHLLTFIKTFTHTHQMMLYIAIVTAVSITFYFAILLFTSFPHWG